MDEVELKLDNTDSDEGFSAFSFVYVNQSKSVPSNEGQNQSQDFSAIDIQDTVAKNLNKEVSDISLASEESGSSK